MVPNEKGTFSHLHPNEPKEHPRHARAGNEDRAVLCAGLGVVVPSRADRELRFDEQGQGEEYWIDEWNADITAIGADSGERTTRSKISRVWVLCILMTGMVERLAACSEGLNYITSGLPGL